MLVWVGQSRLKLYTHLRFFSNNWRRLFFAGALTEQLQVRSNDKKQCKMTNVGAAWDFLDDEGMLVRVGEILLSREKLKNWWSDVGIESWKTNLRVVEHEPGGPRTRELPWRGRARSKERWRSTFQAWQTLTRQESLVVEEGWRQKQPAGNIPEIFMATLALCYECETKSSLRIRVEEEYRIVGARGREQEVSTMEDLRHPMTVTGKMTRMSRSPCQTTKR